MSDFLAFKVSNNLSFKAIIVENIDYCVITTTESLSFYSKNIQRKLKNSSWKHKKPNLSRTRSERELFGSVPLMTWFIQTAYYASILNRTYFRNITEQSVHGYFG